MPPKTTTKKGAPEAQKGTTSAGTQLKKRNVPKRKSDSSDHGPLAKDAADLTPESSVGSAFSSVPSLDISASTDMSPDGSPRRQGSRSEFLPPARHAANGNVVYSVVFSSNEFKDSLSRLDHRFMFNYSSTFATQLAYLEGDVVALRLSLCHPEKFYLAELQKHNRRSIFSADLPFPSTVAELTSAHKLALIDSVVKRIVFDECQVPLNSDVACVSFHEEKQRAQLFQQSSMRGQVPLRLIWEYYGDQVMLYFAWMNHYQAWLTFPALVGGALFTMNYVTGMTNDNNPLVPFYSIVMMLWSIFFVKFWERKEHWLSIEFDMNQSDVTDAEVRRKYSGDTRASPVTGKPEIHYPGWKRKLKQPISWILTAAFLGFSILVQVCSLNLQGYMNAKKHERFEIDFFDQFSRPGRIFDPEGNFAMVPTVLHAVAVLFLNHVYCVMASYLTEWENYRLVSEHEAALTQKRVVFEFIDCFISLFYVAFYRLDLPLLRQELISLFAVDQFRRLLLEAIIPYVWSRKQHQDHLKKPEKVVVAGAAATPRPGFEKAVQGPRKAKSHEELSPEYDQFDDYLEMVMQFGYVTFFAAAFPLAALLSLAGNFFEVRADLFKLAFVLRRPPPIRTKSIGPWKNVLRFLAIGTVISNTLLFCFTSHQMSQFFPSWFNKDGTMDREDDQFIVATAFALEHVLLAIVLFILWIIPSMPGKVRDEVDRRRYLRQIGATGPLERGNALSSPKSATSKKRQ